MQDWIHAPLISAIADEVGTPFYVYSRDKLQTAWLAFDRAFASHPHHICYAVKANSNLAVLNTFAQLGSGFDIVSQGELARVIAAGGSPEKVVFSGVGKTRDEIAFALKHNIMCFNVESASELKMIEQVAAHFNMRAPIALRINPNINAQSHPYISTGLKDNKFGIAKEEALALYQAAHRSGSLQIKGIACHIGSQLVSLTPFVDAFQSLLIFERQLKESGILLDHIDIGGGLGVSYDGALLPSINDYAQALLSQQPASSLKLILEPGRILTANAGALITRVLSLKCADPKRFCIVDAAMNDFIRPALYDARHKIIPLSPSPNTPSFLYDVVGPICESADFFAKDCLLSVNPGDLLAICQTGAYGFVNSSNYNSRPRVAEVMIAQDQFKIVRRREPIEALWALEALW